MSHHGGGAPEHEEPGASDDVLPGTEGSEAGLPHFCNKREKRDNQEKVGELMDVEPGIGMGLKGQGVIRQETAQQQQEYGVQ